MKTFTLLKRDAYDLAAVVITIVREKSADLDFKEIIHLQKTADYILATVKDYSDKYDEWFKQSQALIEIANKKISVFKESLRKNAEKEGKVDEAHDEKINKFVNETMEEVKAEIEKETAPIIKELNEKLGAEEVVLEVDDAKLDILVINFEKFAKEKYTIKSKMVEVYEKMTSAQTK